jgi:hypothetical protein
MRLKIIVMLIFSPLLRIIVPFLRKSGSSIYPSLSVHNPLLHLPSKLGAFQHCIQVFQWFYNIYHPFPLIIQINLYVVSLLYEQHVTSVHQKYRCIIYYFLYIQHSSLLSPLVFIKKPYL